MTVRRVVTGRDTAGKSVFVAAGAAPAHHDYVHIPSMSSVQLWATPGNASIPSAFVDPVANYKSILPGLGGTQFLIVAFPPDAVMMSPSFNPTKAAEENLRVSPGLAECFEPDNPGMHTSDTIDYGIVLEGEIWLELDEGRTERLQKHDVIIQNGTRHAWRNRSSNVALMAFVLIGARRAV